MGCFAFNSQEKEQKDERHPHQDPAFSAGNKGRSENQRCESDHKQNGAQMVPTAGGTAGLSIPLQIAHRNEEGNQSKNSGNQEKRTPSCVTGEDAAHKRSQCQTCIDR